MWIAILGTAFVLASLGYMYLISRFRRFGIVKKLSGGRTWLSILLAVIPLAGWVIYAFTDVVNALIILLHLALFWLIADIVTAVADRIRGKKQDSDKSASDGKFRVYRKGIIVILACAAYLIIGWYMAHNVWKTEYHLTTEKTLPNGRLRVAMIADSHVGTTFDGEGFARYIAEIAETEPDVLVIVGDFVDDSTTYEDLVRSCAAFGEISLPYGIYYVYGNHDAGYYNHRSFDAADIEAELAKNGVTVLKDAVNTIAENVVLIGRKDRSDEKRSAISDLVVSIPEDVYTIVLNHQPNDYEAEAAAGVDLVLSGHTHGGQLLPLGPIGRLIGANDRTYGIETRDATTFIVTSGISDWAIDFKTGTKSEYVIIEVESSR
ncbi:MAG: metallophosphoesterase [Lachnospiraceae bacterium]|nr:metallophosphoesterase [Lachnospiraceae bacterium]